MNGLVTFEILPTTTLEFTIQAAFVEGVGKDYTGPYEVTPQLYKTSSFPQKARCLRRILPYLKYRSMRSRMRLAGQP